MTLRAPTLCEFDDPANAFIRQFMQSVSQETPVFLGPLHLRSLYEHGMCHLNCEHAVKEEGGSVQPGWLVRVNWKRVVNALPFVDLEHHSVWRTPEGRLRDITPWGFDEIGRGHPCLRLFLPDSARPHDHASGLIWCNRNNDPERRFFYRRPRVEERVLMDVTISDRRRTYRRYNLTHLLGV